MTYPKIHWFGSFVGGSPAIFLRWSQTSKLNSCWTCGFKNWRQKFGGFFNSATIFGNKTVSTVLLLLGSLRRNFIVGSPGKGGIHDPPFWPLETWQMIFSKVMLRQRLKYVRGT